MYIAGEFVGDGVKLHLEFLEGTELIKLVSECVDYIYILKQM